MGIWEIKIDLPEHSYFDSATRMDHGQMNSRIITDIIRNQLKENLKIKVKEAMDLVK